MYRLGLIIWPLLAMIFLLHLPRSGFCYRPFLTEDAGVAGKGVPQIEASWDYMEWGNGDVEHALLFVPIYGVTKRLELSLELPWFFHEPMSGTIHVGVGDINLVGKFLILEESKNYPALALKSVVKTASGDVSRGLGSGDTDYSAVVAASKSLGPVMLHSMFGYTFVGSNGDPNIRNIYLYGLAADCRIIKRLHFVSELSGNRHSDRLEGGNPLIGLVGFLYQVSDQMTVDAAARFGSRQAVPDWNTTLGLSYSF